MRRGLRAQKVLVASAARVAPGGEAGPFQWLLPALLVVVVLFAALTLRGEGDRASIAGTAATRAQAVSSAVRESRALQEAVDASNGANPKIKAQAKASLDRVKSELVPLTEVPRPAPQVAAIARDVKNGGADKSLEPVAVAAETLAH